MDHRVQEQTISLFVRPCFIASIDSISEIDSTPVTSNGGGRCSIWIDANTSCVVNGRYNYFRVRYTEQLKRSAAAVHADGRTARADSSTP